MQVGDLVRSIRAHRRENLIGVILKKEHDPRTLHNEVYTVMWNGDYISESVWDYDLVAINDNR